MEDRPDAGIKAKKALQRSERNYRRYMVFTILLFALGIGLVTWLVSQSMTFP